jgi:hypothetical protein
MDWLGIGMGLLGGLALFLFGLDQLEHGLRAAAGDVMETTLTTQGRRMLDHDIRPSETMKRALGALWQSVPRAVELSVRAIVDEDELAAREVLCLRKDINPRIEDLLVYQASRLAESDRRVEILHVEMGVVDALKRAYTLSGRMAELTLRAVGKDSGAGPADAPSGEGSLEPPAPPIDPVLDLPRVVELPGTPEGRRARASAPSPTSHRARTGCGSVRCDSNLVRRCPSERAMRPGLAGFRTLP